MSGKARQTRRKSTRVDGNRSGLFAVKLPDGKAFNSHMKRIEGMLDKAGYVAVPMTGDYILQVADQIRSDLAAAAEAEAVLNAAAVVNPSTNPEGTEDADLPEGISDDQ